MRRAGREGGQGGLGVIEAFMLSHLESTLLHHSHVHTHTHTPNIRCVCIVRLLVCLTTSQTCRNFPFPLQTFALANTHMHKDGNVISEPPVETRRHCTNTGNAALRERTAPHQSHAD